MLEMLQKGVPISVPERALGPCWCQGGAMVVPRSILSDFGAVFGSRFRTKNVENPALKQQLEVFFSTLRFSCQNALCESTFRC